VSRPAVQILLASGRQVDLVIPTVAELLMAYQAGAGKQGRREAMAAMQAAVKAAVRAVDGTATGVHQLAAWPFSSAETLAMISALTDLVSPGPAVAKGVCSAAVVAVDGKATTWTVTLPGPAVADGEASAPGAVVVLRELGWGATDAVLGTADQDVGANLAGEYRVSLEGLKQSLVTVDGNPVAFGPRWLDEWPFTASDTAILAHVWRTMQGITGDAPGFTMVPAG